MNKIFKYITIFFILIFTLFFITTFAKAEDEKVIIHFFYGKGCPHCAKEEIFLENLKSQNQNIKVKYYETWSNQENLNLMKKIGKEINADISGVPFTVIGEHYVSGYLSDETTGEKIKQLIDCKLETQCSDIVENIKNGQEIQIDNNKEKIPNEIEIPILGKINIKNVSLPVLSIVLGIVDGFNPCAMWVLIFLISILINLKDVKRMWILGSLFIFTSAFVYFLFMSAWLNLITFLGFVIWLRIIIAIIAISAGIYYLYDFYKNKNAVCKVTADEKKQKFLDKLASYAKEKNFWIAVGGIMLLAFSVNLIEAICSAGLPVVFTQILSLSNLSSSSYYGYILIYIFFFMLDDLLVFIIAMTTLKLTGLTTKYTRYSHLIGGILMLIIGALLLFKPEWLMFG